MLALESLLPYKGVGRASCLSWASILVHPHQWSAVSAAVFLCSGNDAVESQRYSAHDWETFSSVFPFLCM